MDTVEGVQEIASTNAGMPGGASTGFSSAEPTSAEPSAEPTSAEPSAEGSSESVGASPEAAQPFPQVDVFDWDNWDGSDYEAFPETVKPWADKLNAYHTKSLDSLTSTHGTEIDYWKRMYESLNYGQEDPRVAELNTSLEETTAREQQMQQQLDTLTKEINEEREAENSRYFTWFEKNYQGKLESLATTYGASAAEQMVIDLMDMDMEVHVAVEVAGMGREAVDAAKALSQHVKDSSLIIEILNNRFKTAKATEQDTPRAPSVPNPATQVVAGSAPVSRPAQLSTDKPMTYGSSDRKDRMASLMSAAENAIRKSKRR